MSEKISLDSSALNYENLYSNPRCSDAGSGDSFCQFSM